MTHKQFQTALRTLPYLPTVVQEFALKTAEKLDNTKRTSLLNKLAQQHEWYQQYNAGAAEVSRKMVSATASANTYKAKQELMSGFSLGDLPPVL